MSKQSPDYAKINSMERELGIPQSDYRQFGVEPVYDFAPVGALRPQPKYGWSEDIAQRHVAEESHKARIADFDNEVQLAKEALRSEELPQNSREWVNDYPDSWDGPYAPSTGEQVKEAMELAQTPTPSSLVAFMATMIEEYGARCARPTGDGRIALEIPTGPKLGNYTPRNTKYVDIPVKLMSGIPITQETHV